MASSEGNYHHRGPYFDGTNFASWKHKMKMHILGHNPAVCAIVCIGLQGEFFDGREPNREAIAEELKMLQYNAQACDILFNGLCHEEFNEISRLENAKEIWDTLIDMHEGTDSVKESKLDVLQSKLDKFKMKDGEGVAEMYSRLALITNEIAGLGSEEMTDRFIIKKILRALDGKYDTMCTLIQMMPNYKDLKPTEVIGRIVAHEMSLKDKEELHNKSSGAYKASCDAPTSSSEKQTFNEELSLMVKNFNKFYKSRSKERSSKSRSYNDKISSSRIGRCFMAKGPKVSHPVYADFNSDEDDLLGDDDLLVDNSSDENYDEIAINHANQDKTNDDDKKEIERLTKELNTLKLAHETTLEDHRELLKTHEKLCFEKLNLEEEHGFLKAINDDLRKKSSSYNAKRLLLSTYMPQVKSSNKSKKDSSSSSNNDHVKSNIVASSSSLDSTNGSLSQVTLEQENSLLKGIIEKGVYKSLDGSKQFEEIVRKQGKHRKNQGVGFERKFNANGVEWEEDQYPKTKFVPQQEKYDPTSFQGTQAQDDLSPQDHKHKGKDKLQEEIDAFEEAPKALVKWVPKTTPSSTSSSTTTTPRIPIKMMWIPKKKN
ncbi:hypothetical protein VPH35_138146 [Triticum aestivum]